MHPGSGYSPYHFTSRKTFISCWLDREQCRRQPALSERQRAVVEILHLMIRQHSQARIIIRSLAVYVRLFANYQRIELFSHEQPC